MNKDLQKNVTPSESSICTGQSVNFTLTNEYFSLLSKVILTTQKNIRISQLIQWLMYFYFA